MRLILFGVLSFGKMWKNMLFFRAATARLGSIGLRIDKGSCSRRCIHTDEIKTLGIMITHCTYSESSYSSL